MTVESAVQTIADKMGEAESRASMTINMFRNLRDEFGEIAQGVPGTSLLAPKFHTRLVALATTFGADLLQIHYEMTEEAKRLGIDIPSAPPGEGEIGIFSGGGR